MANPATASAGCRRHQANGNSAGTTRNLGTKAARFIFLVLLQCSWRKGASIPGVKDSRVCFLKGMCSSLATRPEDPQKGGSGKCQFVDGFGVCFLTKTGISGLPSLQHSTGRAFRALFIESFIGSLRPRNSIDNVGEKA